MMQYKRALITGAANGLGRAFVETLLADGTEVFAVDVAKMDDLPHDNKLNRFTINLIHPNQVNALILNLKTHAPFDLIIHNAGVSATGKFEDIPPQAYDNLIQLNVRAPIQMTTQMAQAQMFAQPAHLVFISSLSHAVGYPGASVYAASKDALAIYAKSIRKPFGKSGVCVSCVFPGPLHTDHAERHAPKGARADKRMLPDIAAQLILKDVGRKKAKIYPGFPAKMAAFLGVISPKWMTNLMRKIMFEKLDKPVW